MLHHWLNQHKEWDHIHTGTSVTLKRWPVPASDHQMSCRGGTKDHREVPPKNYGSRAPMCACLLPRLSFLPSTDPKPSTNQCSCFSPRPRVLAPDPAPITGFPVLVQHEFQSGPNINPIFPSSSPNSSTNPGLSTNPCRGRIRII